MRNLVIPALMVSALISGCSKISEEESADVTRACTDLVDKNIGAERSIDIVVMDMWRKKGAIVAEMGYRSKHASSESSYEVRYCVYDADKGTISLPSVLNQSEWSK